MVGNCTCKQYSCIPSVMVYFEGKVPTPSPIAAAASVFTVREKLNPKSCAIGLNPIACESHLLMPPNSASPELKAIVG